MSRGQDKKRKEGKKMSEQDWRTKLAEECRHYAQETRCMIEVAKDIDEALKDGTDPAYVNDLTAEYEIWHRQRNDTRAAIQKLVKEIGRASCRERV